MNAIGGHLRAVPATGYDPPPSLEEQAGRTAELCEQAAAVLTADPPPPKETLELAAQLADATRLLGQALRIGVIAAGAYEAGRLDERIHRRAARPQNRLTCAAAKLKSPRCAAPLPAPTIGGQRTPAAGTPGPWFPLHRGVPFSTARRTTGPSPRRST